MQPSLSISNTQHQGPSPQDTYKKKAKNKDRSIAIASGLANLQSPLRQSYHSTVYKCCQVIEQEDGRLRTWYCGQRWCINCGNIRTARAIGAYLPIVETWDDPYRVNLSLVNCEGENIRERVTQMRKGFYAIVRQIRYRLGKDSVLAIRKLEVTYSIERGDYHPHYHVLVNNAEVAHLLRDLWLKRFPEDCGPRGQWVKRCEATEDNTLEDSLVEIFKYAAKVVTKGRKGPVFIPPQNLDTIYRQIKNLNTWEPFGFKLPKEVADSIESEDLSDTVGTVAFKRATERVTWPYDRDARDWVDMETGECLSEYVRDADTAQLVESVEHIETVGQDDSLPISSPVDILDTFLLDPSPMPSISIEMSSDELQILEDFQEANPVHKTRPISIYPEYNVPNDLSILFDSFRETDTRILRKSLVE